MELSGCSSSDSTFFRFLWSSIRPRESAGGPQAIAGACLVRQVRRSWKPSPISEDSSLGFVERSSTEVALSTCSLKVRIWHRTLHSSDYSLQLPGEWNSSHTKKDWTWKPGGEAVLETLPRNWRKGNQLRRLISCFWRGSLRKCRVCDWSGTNHRKRELFCQKGVLPLFQRESWFFLLRRVDTPHSEI